MKVENPMRFVRELKGAPLSVVVLLMMTGVGMSNGAICNGTGYSDKSVAGALSYLEEIGMVVHSSGGWRMADGMQLALPMVEETGENLDTNGESRRISDSEPLVNIVVNDSNINDLTTNLSNTSGEESEKFRENLAVMAEQGIRATEKTKALARAGHVDALYVLSHVEQVRREGQKIGLAIWRMEKGLERPLLRMENGHLEGCKCNKCGYVDYGQGVMEEEEEWAWFEARYKENS